MISVSLFSQKEGLILVKRFIKQKILGLFMTKNIQKSTTYQGAVKDIDERIVKLQERIKKNKQIIKKYKAMKTKLLEIETGKKILFITLSYPVDDDNNIFKPEFIEMKIGKDSIEFASVDDEEGDTDAIKEHLKTFVVEHHNLIHHAMVSEEAINCMGTSSGERTIKSYKLNLDQISGFIDDIDFLSSDDRVGDEGYHTKYGDKGEEEEEEED